MEAKLKILLNQHLFSFGESILIECTRICHQYDLSPKNLVDCILHFFHGRLKLNFQFSEEAQSRQLTIPVLTEIFNDKSIWYLPCLISEIEATAVLPKTTHQYSSPFNTNNKICREISLKIAREISLFEWISLEPASNSFWWRSCEMCIAGRVLKKGGKWGNDSFFLKAHISSEEERNIIIFSSDLQSYRLFVGQTIIVKGYVTGANFFHAKKIYSRLNKLSPPAVRLPAGISNLKLVVGAGPFILNNSIFHNGFFQYIIRLCSSCVILFGSFVEDTMQLEDFVKILMLTLDKQDTILILVPSLEDDKAFPVFPQPPLLLKEKPSTVILLSNPFSFKLGDIVIAGCSTDVLSHLKNHELVKQQTLQEDESNLVLHILNSKSFYPLNPPEEIKVDYEILAKVKQFAETPNLLFLCSKIKVFAKEAYPGCNVVNPGYGAQYFADVQISNRIFCKIHNSHFV